MEFDSKKIILNDDEIALVRTVCRLNGKDIDDSTTALSIGELNSLGFVRENWAVDELHDKGFSGTNVVTSFSSDADKARSELSVDVPFASGVQKWQLPIGLPNFRVIMTLFPPNTVVELHEHPNFDGVSACGQLRVVVKGSIFYEGQKYGPGDWFFIPNGMPYTFTTDPDVETLENYYYQYNGASSPLRFSSPQATAKA